MTRTAAVTGIGVICALGADRESFWAALAGGESAIAPLGEIDDGPVRIRTGACLRAFDPDDHFEPRQRELLDPFAQYAVVAARQAVADAGLEWSDTQRAGTAVVTGSSMGGQASLEEGYRRLYAKGASRVHPLSIPRIMANSAASAIAVELGLTGPAFTLSTACSSANHALGHGLWLLRQGAADRVLAGGSEAPFTYGNLKAWEALRVVSPTTCRPFSRDRDGMVLGEGAAILVLEPADAARARGARVYAEITGFGMSADAYHVTQPSVEGPTRAMREALRDADLAPADIGYINAHGTGTPTNDPVEARAIRQVFGDHADRLPVSSTKSLHGHALGAAGALEAAATALALHHRLLPPTANFTEADPECDLDVVRGAARPADVAAALSNSFAFGGLNAVLAFRRGG